ncbi:hypothetical protein BC941DRAFT_418185 [Chlamydoabsidia padenii]|nr:hypothetical protein BC941DRAFT_418185 [Chlamydoabsidia padenii]
MVSDNSSPIQPPASSSAEGGRYSETAINTSASSPPSGIPNATTDAQHSNTSRQYRHHSKERDDRSLSPNQRQSSRYDALYERRDGNTSTTYQDLDQSSRPHRRRDYREDDYRYRSNRDDNRNDRNSYVPSSSSSSPPPPASSRHQDRYQPRYGDSRYDARGRRDDYPLPYDHHRSSYYHQQQTHPRDHYSHYPPPSHHHHAPHTRQSPHYRQPYNDRRYQRYDDRLYDSRSRSSRRTVDRGTEEERQRSTIIFVGNLPYDYCEKDVAGMFDRYGKLVKITIPIDAVTTKNKGFAFVEFEERRDAQEAMDNFQGFSVEGRRLKLDWDIGLNKKDTRRAPPPSDDYGNSNNHTRTRSPPSSSSSPPPAMHRGTDTYIPSTGEGSSRRNVPVEPYRT